MVIGTLVRLKQQDRTKCRVWPPSEYVTCRCSWCQKRIINVAGKRQLAAFRPHIRRCDHYILGELARYRNVHLICARPLKIGCYREKASTSGECPFVGERVAAGESIIGVEETSS